jgi:hypothetical protein
MPVTASDCIIAIIHTYIQIGVPHYYCPCMFDKHMYVHVHAVWNEPAALLACINPPLLPRSFICMCSKGRKHLLRAIIVDMTSRP